METEITETTKQTMAAALDRLEFYAGLMPVLTHKGVSYWTSAEGAITKETILQGREELKRLGVRYLEQVDFTRA